MVGFANVGGSAETKNLSPGRRLKWLDKVYEDPLDNEEVVSMDEKKKKRGGGARCPHGSRNLINLKA